jgi:predicted ribosomally synthesized peptide with nif11-like leader
MVSFTPQYLQAMSQEQLKGFLEAVQADVSLQEKLQAISSTSGEDQSVTDDEYDDAIFAVAIEAGFIISAEDLQKLRTELELIENNENNDGDLTDEQLEAVAGGVAFGTAASVLFAAGLLTLGVGGRTGWFSRRFGSR